MTNFETIFTCFPVSILDSQTDILDLVLPISEYKYWTGIYRNSFFGSMAVTHLTVRGMKVKI